MKPAIRSIVATALLSTSLAATAQWNMYTHPPYDGVQSVTTSPGAIYMVAYADGVIKSVDGGSIWNQANTGLPALSNVQSVFHNGSHMFSGTNAGVYRSADNGASWSPNNTGLPTASGSNYAKKFFKTGTTTLAIYSAPLSAGGGIYRTTDNGDNWFNAYNGLSTNMTVYQVAEIGGVLYAATNAGLAKSTNLAVSWTTIATSNFTCYGVQGISGRIIVIGSSGMRYSINSGGSWSDATGDLANYTGGELIVYDGKIWCTNGPSSSELYRSTNNGNTYAQYETGLVGADAIAQYCFHASGTTLYLGTFGHLYGHPGTTLGVAEENTVQLSKPYPTVFSAGFNVDLGDHSRSAELVLVDATGREARRQGQLPNGNLWMERGDLPHGTYRVLLIDTALGKRALLGTVVAQ